MTGISPAPSAHRGVRRSRSTSDLSGLSQQAVPAAPPRALPLDGGATWGLLTSGADHLVHSVQQELVAEGVLHTPIGTTTSCLHKYGLELSEAPSPVAATLVGARPAVSAAALALHADGAVVSRAACLATPVEPVEEGSRGGATATRAAIARLRACAVNAAAEVEAAFCHTELWQRRAALVEGGALAAEYIRKAQAVRRKRRMALVRAVREARDGARTLIKALRPVSREQAEA